MSIAGVPSFRKLWGKIDQDLSQGTYSMIIVNNYDVSSFDGQKHIILSTTSAFGGKNDFLGVLYIFIGLLILIGSVIIFTTHYYKTRRNRSSR